MIIITKDEKEYYPILFGSHETPTYSEYITCVATDASGRYSITGELIKHLIHISEVKAIKGTYSFAPFYDNKKRNKANDPGSDKAK